MNKKEIKRLLQNRERLIKRMMSLCRLIRGSVFKRYSTCSRPECSCQNGKRHGPRWYVASSQDGRQKQHYIPKEQVDAVKQGIDSYTELMRLIDNVTKINLSLMRKRSL